MILYVGGAAQGMEDAVRNRFEKRTRFIFNLDETLRSYLSQKLSEGAVTLQDIASAADEWTERFCSEENEEELLVITCREVGCGVIPMGQKELLWRELVGRVQVELAKRAEEVVRVCCGIPQRIK
ncbi:MAG: bifunctional adenosylcobinamide kinase/adenosylcobinamide-phosphate guanylyltransferase [Eubacterium sp.]|nr:bifunctional adenosylcobinamide kinase/adenosylcobinamide-phosphate guanylyltransferase [Eubacterium sp.]